MTSVIVDASVLVSCALADGTARRTYFGAREVEFYAPEFVREEFTKRVPKILATSNVAPSAVSALMDDLFGRLVVVPRAGYLGRLKEAQRIVARAHAEGDEDYVALALALDAPIWTYDKDFLRIEQVRVVTNTEVLGGHLG